MKSLLGQDLRPVVYVVSASTVQLALVATEARNLECIPLVYESLSMFYSYYDETAPGCIVLCMDQQEPDALNVVDRILQRITSTPVIFVARDWELADIIKAIKQGAVNVLVEPVNSFGILRALSEALAYDRSKRTRIDLSIPEAVAAKLDTDEASVFSLLIQGRTTKQIGSELDLSVRTIHYRKSSMFRKLGVRNRSEAVEMVRRIRRGKPVFEEPISLLPHAS